MIYGKTFTNPASDSSTAVDWNGGTGMFAVAGTFSSATVKLQHKIGSTWVDIGSDASFTADGAVIFTTGATELNVLNSAHTPSVTVTVLPVYENKAF